MEPAILTSTDRLYQHYNRRVQQILFRFNHIRELIRHEGSMGTRVEGVVRSFLLEFLPRRIRSGLVVDSSGSEIDRSRQKDILVVDKFFNPRLFLERRARG
jgi:tRNA G37 N-methylase Trm5